MEQPIICILLTTYKRTEVALSTIRGLKQNMLWGNIMWWVSDDGSPSGHVKQLIEEIGHSYRIETYNSNRKGVGHGMNYSLDKIFEITPLVLVMEDDWYLHQPMDMTPYVRTLMNHEEYGMIRFGYLSTNILMKTQAAENKLYYTLEPNEETYRFTGHPSLRHKRFHEKYGWYREGLAPGETELSMCHNVNSIVGPIIAHPGDYNCYGAFHHIGSESLANVQPS